MPRKDGVSARFKVSRKRRKKLWVDANKKRARSARMKRGGKHFSE